MKTKKIALLGGSFDPFHNAHLQLALTALNTLDIDEVHLLPAGQPWQKKPLSTSPNDRLAMLHIATKPYPNIHINPIEIHRSGPSYTIDTLKQLAPQHHYYWLMGADQLNNFCTWREWDAILDFVQLVIAKRAHYTVSPPAELMATLEQKKQSLVFLPFEEMPISSSDIRLKIQQGENVAHLLPPDVLHYIDTHQLYR